jgi:hypothetical protein
MKLNKDIALAARRNGESSVLYRVAAQKHANAFWIYACIGVGVWWWVEQWWWLIPAFLAVFVAFQSISATAVARRLEDYEADTGE